ncbi:hypothetical protein BJX99DRAFT_132780 [Aspergillus californicus]
MLRESGVSETQSMMVMMSWSRFEGDDEGGESEDRKDIKEQSTALKLKTPGQSKPDRSSDLSNQAIPTIETNKTSSTNYPTKMHYHLTALLSITSALAVPFIGHANYNTKAVNVKMPKALNETTLGHAVVSNRCYVPIYLWSVGENISPQSVVQPGQEYDEIFRRDPKTGGVAIKITTIKDGLYNSSPQTVFAYNLVDEVVWYDLSDVFGDPFQGESVSLLPSEPEIDWEQGVPPSGSQVRRQDAMTDLILTVC